MNKICKYGKIHWNVTPLCGNTWLYIMLKQISKAHNLNFELQIAITYKESHIWANFNPQRCSYTNNRSWIKGKKNDDWTTTKTKLPNQTWCYLYEFATVEEYRESFSNSLKMWYIDAWCDNAVCLSRYYVGVRWPIKPEWVKTIQRFISQ